MLHSGTIQTSTADVSIQTFSLFVYNVKLQGQNPCDYKHPDVNVQMRSTDVIIHTISYQIHVDHREQIWNKHEAADD